MKKALKESVLYIGKRVKNLNPRARRVRLKRTSLVFLTVSFLYILITP